MGLHVPDGWGLDGKVAGVDNVGVGSRGTVVDGGNALTVPARDSR